jgi:hypothetical protein
MTETSAGKPRPKLFHLTYMCMICSVSALVIGHPEASGYCSQSERMLFGRDTRNLRSSALAVSRCSRRARSRNRTCRTMAIQRAIRTMVSKTEDKDPPIETRSKRSRQQGDSSEGDRNRTNTQASLRPTLGESRETCLHYATASGDRGALGGGELSLWTA